VADLEDPLLRRILAGYFGNSNLGLLISNKYPSLFLGDWKKIKDGEREFMASNDTYFRHSFRGSYTPQPYVSPVVKKAEEEKEQTSSKSNVIALPPPVTMPKISLLKDVELSKAGRFLMPSDLSALLNVETVEALGPELIIALSYLSNNEIFLFINNELEREKNGRTCAELIEYLCIAYGELYEDHGEALEDLDTVKEKLAVEEKKHESATSVCEKSEVARKKQRETIVTYQAENKALLEENLSLKNRLKQMEWDLAGYQTLENKVAMN
jgi:hypothetical protein